MRAGGDPTVKQNSCTWAEGCRPCSSMMQETRVISPGAEFTADDVSKLRSELPTSQFVASDVPGQICFRDDGPDSSRTIANLLDNRCVSILGSDDAAKKKCDKVEDVVESKAAPSTWDKIVDYGKWGVGAVSTWAIFGPGMSLWHKIAAGASRAGGAAMLPLMFNPFDLMCAGSDGKDPMCVGRTGGPEA